MSRFSQIQRDKLIFRSARCALTDKHWQLNYTLGWFFLTLNINYPRESKDSPLAIENKQTNLLALELWSCWQNPLPRFEATKKLSKVYNATGTAGALSVMEFWECNNAWSSNHRYFQLQMYIVHAHRYFYAMLNSTFENTLYLSALPFHLKYKVCQKEILVSTRPDAAWMHKAGLVFQKTPSDFQNFRK